MFLCSNRADQEDELERRYKGDCILCDREEGRTSRNQHSVNKRESEAVRVSLWWEKTLAQTLRIRNITVSRSDINSEFDPLSVVQLITMKEYVA